MFKLFKHKEKKEILVSPVQGRVMALSEVNDPVFSRGMMGQGFAVDPKTGEIVAPVEGEILTIAETKHGIGFGTASGMEVLLHLGLDTVELAGQPFSLTINVGDHVKAGQNVGQMSLTQISAAGKEPTVIVVVTNSDDVVESLNVIPSEVSAGDKAAEILLN